jgi:error-prone DNA polymerase
VRRSIGQFTSILQLHHLTRIPKHTLVKLAEADAFDSLGLTRRQALWEASALSDEQLPLLMDGPSDDEPDVELPTMPLQQEVRIDYETVGLSLKRHPVSFVRDILSSQRILTAQQLNAIEKGGRWVKVAGLVLIRQRPGTASGIVFITLEDETGIVNLIVRPDIYDRYRPAARHAALLQCDGYVERQGQVIHVMAKRLFDRSDLIRGYEISSRDFH